MEKVATDILTFSELCDEGDTSIEGLVEELSCGETGEGDGA